MNIKRKNFSKDTLSRVKTEVNHTDKLSEEKNDGRQPLGDTEWRDNKTKLDQPVMRRDLDRSSLRKKCRKKKVRLQLIVLAIYRKY